MELVVPNLGRQMHVEPPEHLVRWCQYLYFCTSKASTFVLVKQARCSGAPASDARIPRSLLYTCQSCSRSSAATRLASARCAPYSGRTLQLLMRQHLYFCTSKARKLSTAVREYRKYRRAPQTHEIVLKRIERGILARSSSGFSIFTFCTSKASKVLVKQVK